MKTEIEREVLVESIEQPELCLGKIMYITYNAEEAIIHVEWPNKTQGLYSAEELEFIINK